MMEISFCINGIWIDDSYHGLPNLLSNVKYGIEDIKITGQRFTQRSIKHQPIHGSRTVHQRTIHQGILLSWTIHQGTVLRENTYRVGIGVDSAGAAGARAPQ